MGESVMENIIGIGGILATIIVGILSCIVTWIVTKKTIEKRKLNYSIFIYPILNLSDYTHELKVIYKGEELRNPCLVDINIKNVGNKSVENPPVEVFCKKSLLLPAYMEDVPCGYEEIWKIESVSKSRVKLNIDYINPQQVLRLRLYADLMKQDYPQVICPKKDLEFVNIEDEVAIKAAEKFIQKSMAIPILKTKYGIRDEMKEALNDLKKL